MRQEGQHRCRFLPAVLLAAQIVPAPFAVEDPRKCRPVNTDIVWLRDRTCDTLPKELEGQVCACEEVRKGSQVKAKVTRGMDWFQRQHEQAEELQFRHDN